MASLSSRPSLFNLPRELRDHVFYHLLPEDKSPIRYHVRHWEDTGGYGAKAEFADVDDDWSESGIESETESECSECSKCSDSYPDPALIVEGPHTMITAHVHGYRNGTLDKTASTMNILLINRQSHLEFKETIFQALGVHLYVELQNTKTHPDDFSWTIDHIQNLEEDSNPDFCRTSQILTPRLAIKNARRLFVIAKWHSSLDWRDSPKAAEENEALRHGAQVALANHRKHHIQTFPYPQIYNNDWEMRTPQTNFVPTAKSPPYYPAMPSQRLFSNMTVQDLNSLDEAPSGHNARTKIFRDPQGANDSWYMARHRAVHGWAELNLAACQHCGDREVDHISSGRGSCCTAETACRAAEIGDIQEGDVIGSRGPYLVQKTRNPETVDVPYDPRPLNEGLIDASLACDKLLAKTTDLLDRMPHCTALDLTVKVTGYAYGPTPNAFDEGKFLTFLPTSASLSRINYITKLLIHGDEIIRRREETYLPVTQRWEECQNGLPKYHNVCHPPGTAPGEVDWTNVDKLPLPVVMKWPVGPNWVIEPGRHWDFWFGQDGSFHDEDFDHGHPIDDAVDKDEGDEDGPVNVNNSHLINYDVAA